MRDVLRFSILAMMFGVLGACSHMPDIAGVTPLSSSAAITPDLAPRERVRVAVALLSEGDERRARAELQAALNDQPNLRSAQSLMNQITNEPRALLAGDPAPYTVRPGETMSMLAERFQGDALLFYALARFNDLDAPNQLSAGQTLSIPRRPGVRAVANAAAVSASPPSSTPAPAQAALAPERGAQVRSPNAQRANQLRLQGLQLLNAGEVDRAVAILRQAQGLDSGNDAIRRDLDRATRLQTSLNAQSGAAR